MRNWELYSINIKWSRGEHVDKYPLSLEQTLGDQNNLLYHDDSSYSSVSKSAESVKCVGSVSSEYTTDEELSTEP